MPVPTTRRRSSHRPGHHWRPPLHRQRRHRPLPQVAGAADCWRALRCWFCCLPRAADGTCCGRRRLRPHHRRRHRTPRRPTAQHQHRKQAPRKRLQRQRRPRQSPRQCSRALRRHPRPHRRPLLCPRSNRRSTLPLHLRPRRHRKRLARHRRQYLLQPQPCRPRRLRCSRHTRPPFRPRSPLVHMQRLSPRLRRPLLRRLRLPQFPRLSLRHNSKR